MTNKQKIIFYAIIPYFVAFLYFQFDNYIEKSNQPDNLSVFRDKELNVTIVNKNGSKSVDKSKILTIFDLEYPKLEEIKDKKSLSLPSINGKNIVKIIIKEKKSDNKEILVIIKNDNIYRIFVKEYFTIQKRNISTTYKGELDFKVGEYIYNTVNSII